MPYHELSKDQYGVRTMQGILQLHHCAADQCWNCDSDFEQRRVAKSLVRLCFGWSAEGLSSDRSRCFWRQSYSIITTRCLDHYLHLKQRTSIAELSVYRHINAIVILLACPTTLASAGEVVRAAKLDEEALKLQTSFARPAIRVLVNLGARHSSGRCPPPSSVPRR